MTMMSHLLLREVIKMLFHQMTKEVGGQWLGCTLITEIMREIINPHIMFLIQIPLLRELDVDVEKQDSILQPCCNAVLMANLNVFH
jgi:hypothetical protein